MACQWDAAGQAALFGSGPGNALWEPWRVPGINHLCGHTCMRLSFACTADLCRHYAGVGARAAASCPMAGKLLLLGQSCVGVTAVGPRATNQRCEAGQQHLYV